MRLSGLGGDHNVGTIARRTQRNGLADATTSPRDEKRFTFEAHVSFLSREAAYSTANQASIQPGSGGEVAS